jgi:hypothetical protein
MQNDLNTIDTLGSILAQIAELEQRANEIKDQLRDAATQPNGTNVFEGSLFKATVVASDRATVNYKKLLVELGATDEQVARHTSRSISFAVRVTSR